MFHMQVQLLRKLGLWIRDFFADPDVFLNVG